VEVQEKMLKSFNMLTKDKLINNGILKMLQHTDHLLIIIMLTVNHTPIKKQKLVEMYVTLIVIVMELDFVTQLPENVMELQDQLLLFIILELKQMLG
jgi:hypothetical protein